VAGDWSELFFWQQLSVTDEALNSRPSSIFNHSPFDLSE